MGGGGSISNLEKTTASVLHKELDNKVEKLKYKKVGGHAVEVQWSNLNFQLVNKPTIPDQSAHESFTVVIDYKYSLSFFSEE